MHGSASPCTPVHPRVCFCGCTRHYEQHPTEISTMAGTPGMAACIQLSHWCLVPPPLACSQLVQVCNWVWIQNIRFYCSSMHAIRVSKVQPCTVWFWPWPCSKKSHDTMHVFAHTAFYITHTVGLCIIKRGLLCGHGWVKERVQNCYLYRLLVLLDELLRSVTALVRSQWLGISSTRVVTIQPSLPALGRRSAWSAIRRGCSPWTLLVLPIQERFQAPKVWEKELLGRVELTN